MRMFTCDHMRGVARVNGQWHHLDHEGRVGSTCAAGVYGIDLDNRFVVKKMHVLNFMQEPKGDPDEKIQDPA